MRLDARHDFHVVSGGAAGGLLGLMFVVVSVGQIGARSRADVRAFISPTAVFFGSVLVVALTMLMPVLGDGPRGIAIASVGTGGTLIVGFARAHRQLKPHGLGVEDAIAYLVAPVCAYLGLIGAGVALLCHADIAPTIVGVAAIILLIVSMRNAWDLVISLQRAERAPDEKTRDREWRKSRAEKSK